MPKKRSRKYRSKFEAKIADQLTKAKIHFAYEAHVFAYTKVHRYTPDFRFLKKDGRVMFIETKGRFLASDRTKMIAVQVDNAYPDVRLVFMKDLPLYKGSKTKYSDWAKKYGFKYAIGSVPSAWLKEVETN